MIKGSLTERQEYEEYIRSHKDNIYYPFWNMYWESRKLIRYYFIKKAKEKREFELQEKHLINLMTLIDSVARIGGLIYTWYWEESLPNLLLNVANSKPNWVVSVKEIAEVFIEIPSKTVESVLLKAKTPCNIVCDILEAHRNRDTEAFSKRLSVVPIDEIFTSFTIIKALWRQSYILSKVGFDVDKHEKASRYELIDAFELLNVEGKKETVSIVDKTHSVIGKLSEFDDDEITQDPQRITFALCVAMKLAHCIFEYWLGESDPIPETMGLIINEPIFQGIYNQYVQFPRDIEKAKCLVIQCIKTLNEIYDDDIPEDIFDEETDDTQNEGSKETMLQPVDYREYFVSKAPKIDYKTMRDIAVRLSGKVNKDKGLVDSGVAYLRPQDVARFCYFFLHEIAAPDNIADVDFSKPIKWLANWQSQKYFIYKLYGKPKPFPSGMAEDVVACFRFKRERNTSGLKEGQVKLSTYKNSKDPLVIVSDDNKKRIDNILKEFGL